MNTTRVVAAVSALLLAFAANLHGQDVKVGGQIRPRSELRRVNGKGDMFTSMRSRVDVRAVLGPRVQAFVQAQDVRLWGEEASTTASLDRIDLHQAYLDFGTWARVGRQELSYGEERLIGAVDWVQTARSLDGVRLRATSKKATFDALAFQVADAAAAAGRMDDRFFGAYGTLPSRLATVELYALRNQSSAAKPTRQNTFGTRVSGTYGALLYRGEVAMQRGRRAGLTANAAMTTAYVGAKHDKLQGLLWFDHLSGDANNADSEVRVFDTVFATNHKFYGIADVFTNIPLHTGNRGLNDFALKTTYRMREDLTWSADVHRFTAGESSGLSSSKFGDEVDLSGTYRYSPRLSVTGGAARFVVGSGLRAVLPQSSSQSFSFLMLSAVF